MPGHGGAWGPPSRGGFQDSRRCSLPPPPGCTGEGPAAPWPIVLSATGTRPGSRPHTVGSIFIDTLSRCTGDSNSCPRHRAPQWRAQPRDCCPHPLPQSQVRHAAGPPAPGTLTRGLPARSRWQAGGEALHGRCSRCMGGETSVHGGLSAPGSSSPGAVLGSQMGVSMLEGGLVVLEANSTSGWG